MRGKRGIAGGDRETESERGEEVGERREREMTLAVPLEGRIE